MKPCSFEDCGRPGFRYDLCDTHYRYYLKGQPLKPIPVRHASLAEYFWARVNKTGDCWEWTGTLNGDGYGTGCFKRKRYYAHRVSYQLNIGRIPDGMLIDHMCHNPACVNPKHLRLADKKRNSENYSGLLPTNTSGARGVYWHAQTKKWCVQVTHNGKRYAGGLHFTVDDAEAAARDLRNNLHTFNDRDRIPA